MKKITNIMIMLITVILLQGCGSISLAVKNPNASNISYEKVSTKHLKPISISDARSEGEKVFTTGSLSVNLKLDRASLDPMKYLKENIEIELKSRGVPVVIRSSGVTDIKVKTLTMRNHRSSGFSPYVTLTMLSAEVETKNGKERIVSYLKRGKVPVWSFNEIIEPTVNQPLAIIVKEFAAKINTLLYGYRVSDRVVSELVEKIELNKKSNLNYLDVYQLGFSNNKSAIKHLKRLTKSNDEYARHAAISSLGILKAKSEFKYLTSLYHSKDSSFVQRLMILKAIGDFNSKRGNAFLRDAEKGFSSGREKDWGGQLIALYLN